VKYVSDMKLAGGSFCTCRIRAYYCWIEPRLLSLMLMMLFWNYLLIYFWYLPWMEWQC